MNDFKPFDRYLSIARSEHDISLMISINNSNTYLKYISTLCTPPPGEKVLSGFLDQYACAMRRVPDFISLLNNSQMVKPSDYFMSFFDKDGLQHLVSLFFNSSPIAYIMRGLRVDTTRVSEAWSSVVLINLMLPLICSIRRKYSDKNHGAMSYHDSFSIIESFLRERFKFGFEWLCQYYSQVNQPNCNSDEAISYGLMKSIATIPLNHAAHFNMFDLTYTFSHAFAEPKLQ